LNDIMQVTVEHLDAHRAARKIAQTTSHKELQILRQFFGFCVDRQWVEENPAKKIKLPQNIKPTESPIHAEGGREDCCGLRRYRQFK
jgi:site-specific recombinase XerD